ncbi:SDR family NAD(P)-dependent oxidoreductase [Agromyces seonyuensis]|uniref:SDR family NAD(P)-dependent oxidoreductase n=1 Tax=Agromyces seonyuensis TaxID=2662446 RepID=A0A6I4NYN8_9MICO|nr:SDR family oxidoreductase [Agromyces seonyuensis]MWB99443.1 SDR family NAD(P)-dependent oxidoreductase [Agromyces seonyuensis]
MTCPTEDAEEREPGTPSARADAPRAALITGGSRGIGLAIARRLAADGFALTLSARTADSLADAAAELRAAGASVTTVAADAADPEALAALLDWHARTHGRLDALVLNAGMGFGSPIDQTPLRRLDKHVALNFRGAFALVSAALPLLRATAAVERRGTRVIALASLAGLTPEPDLAVYSATKAAIVSLCQSICIEEASTGVSATALCPGYVDTDMAAWKHDMLAADEMIRPDDLAELAVSLTRLSRNAAVPTLPVYRAGGRLVGA